MIGLNPYFGYYPTFATSKLSMNNIIKVET